MGALRYRIVDDQVLHNCVTEILTRKARGEIVNVILSDKDETRTLAQNRLYWLWVHKLAQDKGWDDGEMHLYLKRRFLAVIYAKDDGEMLQTIESLQIAKNQLPRQRYEHIARSVANGLRSSQANSKQFTEYLDNIERWNNEQGFEPLPLPPDLEWVR